MKKTYNSKWKIAASLALAASFALADSVSAAVLLTDNFTVTSNSQNVNQELAGRQAGPLALATYTGIQDHHQVGNTGTDVGQPGGPSNSGYVLTAFNGRFQSDLDIAGISTGTLTIEFDMYQPAGGSTDWGAFTVRREGQTFPVAGGQEFGFLHRQNGALQVFQNGGTGSASGQAGWDTAGFAPSRHWKLIFTDTAGTGSAFVGNGSKVTFINGTTTLGTITLGQNLHRSGLKLGWQAAGTILMGIDNLSIEGTSPTTVIVTAANQSGGNPFTPSWTAEAPSLIAGLSPTTANGNFVNEGAGGTPVLTDGTIGTSGTIGGFATCGGSGGGGNTLIYTLTNVVNGSDVTNIVVYSGWGDGGRQGQYYDVSYNTIANPTYIPIATVFFLPISGGGGAAMANQVKIAKIDGSPLGTGIANIKFDFSSPPQSGSFNNGYQGYSEIIVQGGDTAAPPPPPSPFLVLDTLPHYAETVVGDTVVFTAAYSNDPPATLQWQSVIGGVTNDILGATSETLTLSNVQTTDSGTYRLKAVNATNGLAAPSYSTGAPLLVGSTPAAVNNIIVKYASQNFPSSTNFFPAWPVDTNTLSLIAGFTSGAGEGTFVGVGDFAGGNNGNGDAAVLSDGIAASMTSTPNLAFTACGTLNDGGTGQSMTYQLVTNASPFGITITNITVFGGWQDAGRDQQKYQVLYSTVEAPGSFVPMLTVSYNPTDPGNKPSVSRTTLVPVGAALAQNVAALRFNWNLSPGPENGWEGYSEILVGGTPSAGFVPALTNDVSPLTASDVVGGQIIITAGFSGADSLQWKKNGTDVSGATSATLTLNNLQLTDAGAYTLVASNIAGLNNTTVCTVSVSPAPTATNNIITTIATQTSDDSVFTPTWDTSVLASSLINGVATSSQGDGDFSGGTFGPNPTGGSSPTVLTDGTFGTIDFNVTSLHGWVTCIGSGTGVNNAQGGNYVTYTLPVSANGYDITNIMTAGGWNDGGRDQQSYTVNYATAANPTHFMRLAVVSYNPTSPIGYSMNRATITPASGVLAANVVALQFDMTTPAGENGFSGYSEIAAYGTASASPETAGVGITVEHQQDITTWTAETPNLIAGRLPTTQGPGIFTSEGCNVVNMTDGVLGFGSAFGASCGADTNASVSFVTFNSNGGWDLTNIVVYTLWHDYGREAQFYNVSYSTLAAPSTFLPLGSVAYNAPMAHDGRDSGVRVAITPQIGQTALASNVAVLKFDFTPQAGNDFGWSGYTEIVLQGTQLATPIAPPFSPATVSGGDLILTGTGGTPVASYTLLTTTDLTAPIVWTSVATGVLDGSGSFSNAVPINIATPARFFRVQIP